MPSEPYRRLYASLVRLYPREYRERYGEGMRQTFNDLVGDRLSRNGRRSDVLFILWIFVETFAGILSEYFSLLTSSFMSKTILRPLLITLGILVLPAIGELTVESWDWGMGGFLLMGTLLFVTFLMIELISRQSRNVFYKIAVALTTLTTLGIIYVNLAVGIIGDGNNTSACYFLVVPVGFIGLAVSRLKPRGLSITAFLMAAVVLLVPTIAWLIGNPDIHQETQVVKVFVLSGILAASYVVAGLLFRSASK